MARTAADSAPTHTNTSGPSNGSSAATASGSRVLSPGDVPVAVQPAHGDPLGNRHRLFLRGVGHLDEDQAPRARLGRAGDAGDGGQRRLVADQQDLRGRSLAQRAAAGHPERGTRCRGRGPGGGRPVAVQHEVDLHLAGDRVLAAGGVAAQGHAVGADRPDDPAVAGDLRPARVRVADPRDEQRDRRSRGPDRVRGAGQHDAADGRRDVGDGGDGEHVHRSQVRRLSSRHGCRG